MSSLSKNAQKVIEKSLKRKEALEDKIANRDLRDEKLDDLLAELNNVLCILNGYEKITNKD